MDPTPRGRGGAKVQRKIVRTSRDREGFGGGHANSLGVIRMQGREIIFNGRREVELSSRVWVEMSAVWQGERRRSVFRTCSGSEPGLGVEPH